MVMPGKFGKASRIFNVGFPEYLISVLEEIRWAERASSIQQVILELTVEALKQRGMLSSDDDDEEPGPKAKQK